MFGKVALAVGAAIAGVLSLASRKPDTFIVRRSTTIRATAPRIFGFLEDFRHWTEWSPWETLDPELKRTYGGASAGMGATYAWEGKKAGAGDMEIVELSPPHRLNIRLNFTKPIKASNSIEFRLTDVGDGTRVDWEMTGTNGFVNKVMGVFISMDRLVGKDFERGLTQLKAVAEAEPDASQASVHSPAG